MIKGKYKLTIFSDNKDVLDQFRSHIIEDGIDQFTVFDEAGVDRFYPKLEWDYKHKSTDLSINCDFTEGPDENE